MAIPHVVRSVGPVHLSIVLQCPTVSMTNSSDSPKILARTHCGSSTARRHEPSFLRQRVWHWPQHAGTAVEPRRLRAINTAAKALGISGVGLHRLRHATRMLAAGVPLHTVSELLGHSSVAVTGDVHSPRLQPGHALRRSAALSSHELVRMCAMATPMATRQQRGRLGFCPKWPLTCCFPSG